MPSFAYTVIDSEGARKVGVLTAERMDDAVKKLQKEYTTIVKVREAKSGTEDEKQTISQVAVELYKGFVNQVPAQNILFFTRQLSTMFAAGITLEKALSKLAKNEKHKKFKEILLDIQKDIQSGKPFSDSIAKYPSVFPPLYSSLVHAGEISGTLSEILDGLANYLEKSSEVKQKVSAAMTYPIVVLSILALSVLLLVLVVAPKFNAVYESFGAKLPIPTQILMDVSSFLIDNAALGIFGGVVLVGAVGFFLATPRGKVVKDFISIRIPVMGVLLSNAIMARFSRTLGMLMRANVPVLDSFTLVSKVVNHKQIEKAVVEARSHIQDGRQINRSLSLTEAFPDILIQLVDTGEESGEIDALLIKCAEFYEKEVDTMMGKITSIIEPLMIVLLGGIVGTLVIVIYLPIFYLGSAMRQGL